ncbi:MAG: DJ-1/PfpI family protein [Eubacterium ramulus]
MEKCWQTICAAPGMISETGILKEKRATGYPGCKPEGGAIWSEDAAVVDGNLVTGKGPGAAAELAIEIIRYLAGDIKAEQIRTSTMM